MSGLYNQLQKIQRSMLEQSVQDDLSSVAQKATKSFLHLNVKEAPYNAKGDGATDDTVAIQSFINDITSQHRVGIMPSGTYIISSEISVPSQYAWSLLGANGNSTIIQQNSDNIPILHFQSTPSNMYGVQIKGINFTYKNTQPSTNTNANPLTIETMPYECVFDDLVFGGGAYGFYVKDTTGQNPWGCIFDNLRFTSGMTIGAIRMNSANGVPNNKFGRIFCDCTNMIGPVFNIKGYNSVIETIEFIQAYQGAELMYFQAGAIFEIGAIKLENGNYTKSGYLFELSPSCKIHIGSINIGGSNNMTLNPSSGDIYIIGTTGGSPNAETTIGHIEFSGTSVAKTYVFGAMGNTILHSLSLKVSGVSLTDLGSTTAAETIIVKKYLNDHLSQDKGDANYTVAYGDPNIFQFNTPLTAPRTVTLPNDGTYLFNGLKYRCVVGANVATSSNTLTIKSGANTLATITTGKVIVEFTWRRVALTFENGWVMTGYMTTP